MTAHDRRLVGFGLYFIALGMIVTANIYPILAPILMLLAGWLIGYTATWRWPT